MFSEYRQYHLGCTQPRVPQVPKKNFYNLFGISQGSVKDEVDFCVLINVKGFFKVNQACVARHAQITQSNKFGISLQYLKKEVSDEVDFLKLDKHESLLQIDTMILMRMVQHSQTSMFAMSLQYLKKEVRNGFHFLHADKHQSFYKLALLFLMEVVRYVQST